MDSDSDGATSSITKTGPLDDLSLAYVKVVYSSSLQT